MGRVLIFKVVFAFITLTLLLFQVIIWKKLASRLAAIRHFHRLRIAYFVFVAAGQSVLWFAVFYPGRGLTKAFPDWYVPLHGILLSINYSHAIWLLPLGFFWLAGMLLKRLSRPSPAPLHLGDGGGVSRAEFLQRAAGMAAFGANLLPVATSAAAISGIFLGSREIQVLQKEIRVADLHDDLKGLRIVQISDIHIGNLIGERYLNFTLELMRQARPDYAVVTGDIIDNNNAFLPVAGNFFSLLEAMLNPSQKQKSIPRLLGVLGNHDLIDDGLKAAQAFNASGLKILRNDVQVLARGRGKLQLAGLDYPPLGRGRSDIMRMYFSEVKEKLRDDMPVVLLNHNPADFEFLKTQKIDLVLSGHTHGGQINFSKEQNSLRNGAHWVYKYYVDHYIEQGAQLYVNRGLGHWFPLRLNCPPEITVLTLT